MPIQPEDLDQFFVDLRKKHNRVVTQQKQELRQMQDFDHQTGRDGPNTVILTEEIIISV